MIRGKNSNAPDFPRIVVTWELEKSRITKQVSNQYIQDLMLMKRPKKYNEGWSYFLNELVKFFGENKITEAHPFFVVCPAIAIPSVYQPDLK